MNSFKFDLGQQVRISASGETGHLIGRAEYTTSANNYMVRYKTASGTASETWWQEDALEAVETAEA